MTCVCLAFRTIVVEIIVEYHVRICMPHLWSLLSPGFRSGADHFFFFVITLIGLSTAGVCVVFSIGAVIGVFTVAQNVYSLFFTFSLVNTTLNDIRTYCIIVCLRIYVSPRV